MVKPFRLFPLNWTIVAPGKWAQTTARASVQVFGVDEQGRTVYLRFPALTNYILSFGVTVDDELIADIKENFAITDVRLSPSNPYVLIIRDPNFIPETIDPILISWTTAIADPGGPLASLWYWTGMRPFTWMMVNSYRKLTGTQYVTSERAYTTQERFLTPAPEGMPSLSQQDSSKITEPTFYPRLLAWDFECYNPRSEFPSADNPADVIFMVSLVRSDLAILITSQPVDILTVKQKFTIPLQIIIVSDEQALLREFMEQLLELAPDWLVSFNGDSFDVPYWIGRMRIHRIPWQPFGKIVGLLPKIKRARVFGAFGLEWLWQAQVVGVEWMDLLHYYRKYEPQFKNFRLDTITKQRLGQGKTALSIAHLMNAVTTHNLETLNLGAVYAVTDSLRLIELCEKDNLVERIITATHNLCCTPQQLLQSPTSTIIDGLISSLDPGAVLLLGNGQQLPATREAKVGIYRMVYGYHYTDLYLQLMAGSTQPLAVQLAAVLGNGVAYPKLIAECFYSAYVEREGLMEAFNVAMANILASDSIITMDATYLRSYRPLSASFLQLKEELSGYVAIGKASYLLVEPGQLTSVGVAGICKPKAPWHQTNFFQWLKGYLINPQAAYQMTDLPTDISEFTLSRKLTSTTVATDPLMMQYGQNIGTWTMVNYLYTNLGPMLVDYYSKYTGPGVVTIGYGHYVDALVADIKQIQKLMIYG